MKRMLVDPSATIVFFTILACFAEQVIAGMPLETVFLTQLLMVLVTAFTGRPYGLFLAFVRCKAGVAAPKAQGT